MAPGNRYAARARADAEAANSMEQDSAHSAARAEERLAERRRVEEQQRATHELARILGGSVDDPEFAELQWKPNPEATTEQHNPVYDTDFDGLSIRYTDLPNRPAWVPPHFSLVDRDTQQTTRFMDWETFVDAIKMTEIEERKDN